MSIQIEFIDLDETVALLGIDGNSIIDMQEAGMFFLQPFHFLPDYELHYRKIHVLKAAKVIKRLRRKLLGK